jgi:hypothetical protein
MMAVIGTPLMYLYSKYSCEFWGKNEMELRELSGARGKIIHEKA